METFCQVKNNDNFFLRVFNLYICEKVDELGIYMG